MKKFLFTLQRIENNLSADLHVIITNKGVVYSVVSDSYDLKNHLNSILNEHYYTLIPTTNIGKEYVFSVNLPNTKEHFIYLYDLLSWRGYKVIDIEVIETKSLLEDILEYEDEVLLDEGNDTSEGSLDAYSKLKSLSLENVVLKAASDFSRYIREENGVKYLVRVPQGFYAVNTKDGKVLQGGKYLNIPLDDILSGGKQYGWILIPKDVDVELNKKQINIAASAELAGIIDDILGDLPDLPPEDKERLKEYEDLQKKAYKALKDFYTKKGGKPNQLGKLLETINERTQDYIKATLESLEKQISKKTSGIASTKEGEELVSQLNNIYAYSPSEGLYTTAFEALRYADITDWVYFTDNTVGMDKNAIIDKFISKLEGPHKLTLEEQHFLKLILSEPKILEDYPIMEYAAQRFSALQLPISLLPVMSGQVIKIPEALILSDAEVSPNARNKRFGFFIPKPGKTYTLFGEQIQPAANKFYITGVTYTDSKNLEHSSLKDTIDRGRAIALSVDSPSIQRRIRFNPKSSEGRATANILMAEDQATADGQIAYLDKTKEAQYRKSLFGIFFSQDTGKVKSLKEVAAYLKQQLKLDKQPVTRDAIIKGLFDLLGIKNFAKLRLPTNFAPTAYQLYGALLAANPISFRHSGGLPSKVGLTYFWEAGMGKTITALLALEFGRIAGIYNENKEADPDTDKLAKRPFLIIAPNNLISNWINDAATALGWVEGKIAIDRQTNQLKLHATGPCIIRIEGTPEERRTIYKYLLDLHIKGQLPENIKGIIVGTQKLSRRSGDAEAVDEIKNLDLKYLSYLSGPVSYFENGERKLKEHGLFRAVVIDEAGQIMHEEASRTANIYALASRISSDQNKGLVFSLNAESQANTPQDTVNILRLNDTAGQYLEKYFGVLDAQGRIFGNYFLPRTQHLMTELNIDDIVNVEDYKEVQNYREERYLLAAPAVVYPTISILGTYNILYNLQAKSKPDPIQVDVLDKNGNITFVVSDAAQVLNRYRTAFISFLQELSYGSIPWNRFLEYGYEEIPSLYDIDDEQFDSYNVFLKAQQIYRNEKKNQSAELTAKDPNYEIYIQKARDEIHRQMFNKLIFEILYKKFTDTSQQTFPALQGITKFKDVIKADDDYIKTASTTLTQTIDNIKAGKARVVSVKDKVKKAALSAVKTLIASKKHSFTVPADFDKNFEDIFGKIMEIVRFEGIKAGRISLNLLDSSKAGTPALDIYLPNFPSGTNPGFDTPEIGEMEESTLSAIGIATDKDKTGSERKLIIQKRDEILRHALTLATLHAIGAITLDKNKPISVQITPVKDEQGVVHSYSLDYRYTDATGRVGDVQDLAATYQGYTDLQRLIVENMESGLSSTIYRGQATEQTLSAFLSALKRLSYAYDPTKGEIVRIGTTGSKSFRFLKIGGSRRYIEALDRLLRPFGGSPGIYKGAIVGGIDYSTQTQIAENHRTSPVSITIGTTDASGRGLNLNSDEAVITSDPSFEVTRQVEGRAFRLGTVLSDPSLNTLQQQQEGEPKQKSKPAIPVKAKPAIKTKIHMMHPVGVLDILREKTLHGAYTALTKLVALTELQPSKRAKKQAYQTLLGQIQRTYEETTSLYNALRSELYLARFAAHSPHLAEQARAVKFTPAPNSSVKPIDTTKILRQLDEQATRYITTKEQVSYKDRIDKIRKEIEQIYMQAAKDENLQEFARILKEFFFDIK